MGKKTQIDQIYRFYAEETLKIPSETFCNNLIIQQIFC